jgi:hypothetical protein
LLLLYVDGDQTPSTRTTIALAIQTSCEGLARLATSWKVAERALLAINALASGCLSDSLDTEALDLLDTLRDMIPRRRQSSSSLSLMPDPVPDLDFSALLNDDVFLMHTPW